MSGAWLDEKVILEIHAAQIARHGGLAGLRDRKVLQACIAAPFQGFGGTEFYPGPAAKASRLAFEIITQHPFVDGNKRTGMASLFALYIQQTGIALRIPSEQIVRIGNDVADGRMSYEELADYVGRRAADLSRRDISSDDGPVL